MSRLSFLVDVKVSSEKGESASCSLMSVEGLVVGLDVLGVLVAEDFDMVRAVVRRRLAGMIGAWKS
jgi:hypothetical protein